jgi:hypothetical protein
MKIKYRAILQDKENKKLSKLMNKSDWVFSVGDDICFDDDVLTIASLCYYAEGTPPDIGVFFTIDGASIGRLSVEEMLEKVLAKLGIEKYEK